MVDENGESVVLEAAEESEATGVVGEYESVEANGDDDTPEVVDPEEGLEA